jgi:hypothetical protein
VYFRSTKTPNLFTGKANEHFIKFGSNWPRGFREEDQNVSVYRRRRQRTPNDGNTSLVLWLR